MARLILWGLFPSRGSLPIYESPKPWLASPRGVSYHLARYQFMSLLGICESTEEWLALSLSIYTNLARYIFGSLKMRGSLYKDEPKKIWLALYS